MTRLLFAAARGAALEQELRPGYWASCIFLEPAFMDAFPDRFRIHPDDEHLQYGPISSALRVLGQGGKKERTNSMHIAWTYVKLEVENWNEALQSEHTLPLLTLILAEALADEGL